MAFHQRLYLFAHMPIISCMKVRKPLESVFCEFKKEVLLLPISSMPKLVAYPFGFFLILLKGVIGARR